MLFLVFHFFKNVPSFEYEITFYLLNKNKNKKCYTLEKNGIFYFP
jgi:hypothetical protein